MFPAHEETFVGMGEEKNFFCAGHADVEEASFLLWIARVALEEPVGQESVFAAGDEDALKLETFRRVEGHERHGFHVVLMGVDGRAEGGEPEEAVRVASEWSGEGEQLLDRVLIHRIVFGEKAVRDPGEGLFYRIGGAHEGV